MKGRIAPVFWLVVVLAVLCATSSYAWLAMNVSARLRGIELEAFTDSISLEISAEADTGYDTSVSLGYTSLYSSAINTDGEELSFITYKQISPLGAIGITPVRKYATDAPYDGTGRYYKAVGFDKTDRHNSYAAITGSSYVDVTDTLTLGQSLAGLYTIIRGSWYTVSNNNIYDYYYEQVRSDGTIDYVCIGKIPAGEALADRVLWGYAMSNELEDAQENNIINIVSLDFPPKEYRLHKTVYLRCAAGTQDARDLSVSEIQIDGHSYLEGTIRIMFVATSGSGETVTRFYSHREPGNFNGDLFPTIYGDEEEVVKVDMYVFFDGADMDAYARDSIFTRSDITVKFSIADHDYN